MLDYKLKTILNKNFKPVRFRSQGKQHYQIFLEIHSDADPELQKLEKVEYVLHPSFKQRIRSSSERKNHFRIEIKAWGWFIVNLRFFTTDGKMFEEQQSMKQYWKESYV